MEKFIIKMGTDSNTRILESGTRDLDLNVIQDLGIAIQTLISTGHKVSTVMSGAVTMGKKEVDLSHIADEVSRDREYAAVGQVPLITAIRNNFTPKVAQFLLDEHRDSDWHLRAESLMKAGIIPVINNNDPISPSELERTNGGDQIGDNDQTATKAGIRLNADKLLIGTGKQGLINPQTQKVIDRIKVGELSDEQIAQLCTLKSETGRGGMESKLKAIREFVISDIKRSSGIFYGKAPGQINNFGTPQFNGTTITN